MTQPLLRQADLPPAPQRPRARGLWTAWEDETLRLVYPVRGILGSLECLDRSRGAIFQRAAKLKIAGPGVLPSGAPGGKAGKYPVTPAIDDAIRTALKSDTRLAAARFLARRIRRPVGWVRQRARVLGLSLPRYLGPWAAGEDALLERCAHLAPRTISKRLAKRGWKRTEVAVVQRLKKLQLERLNVNGHFSAGFVAAGLGVEQATVVAWIRKGLLPAGQRDGGHQYDITRADLRAFVGEHPNLIDLRKVDQFWFIEELVRP